MKKLILVLMFSLVLITPSHAGTLERNFKTFGTSALWGSLGGALLGVASMAFGANSLWVAKGASIGLYAGLMYGGYLAIDYGTAPDIDGRYQAPGYTPYNSDDYDDVYYGNRWRSQSIKVKSKGPFNKAPMEDGLKVFFNLFQTNF